MGELYFIGHNGRIKTLKRKEGKIMYVPDSNLVLKLLQQSKSDSKLESTHLEYLRVTRNRAYRLWNQQQRWIPINPVLAIMELSKQDKRPDFKSYLRYYNDFFGQVYNINNCDEKWIYSVYITAMRQLVTTHPSIAKTIKTAYTLIPDGDKPSDEEILKGIDLLLQWLWINKENLEVIGGPVLYVCTYAIAGSPDARKIIKLKNARKENSNIELLAKNIAWDLLYWVMLEFEYHYAKYSNTILCTEGKDLANLLAQRVNSGPRGQIRVPDGINSVELDGQFKPFKFKRLEGTKLEYQISIGIMEFLKTINNSTSDFILFGENKLNEIRDLIQGA